MAEGLPKTLDGLRGEAVDAALDALPEGEHREKMEDTVLLLAFADVHHIPRREVFLDERVCCERVWYQKWQNLPEVKAALTVCTREARRVKRAARNAAMAGYVEEYELELARGQVMAVKGLQLTALNREDRADYRTDASKVLLAIQDEALAERFGMGKTGAALPVEVTNAGEFEVSTGFVADVLRELGTAGGVGGANGAADPGIALDSAQANG